MVNNTTIIVENQTLEEMRLPDVALSQTALSPEELADFRLPQDYQSGPVTRKMPASVSIQKPSKGGFVRTHKEFHFDGLIIDDPDTGEPYLVSPGLAQALDGEFARKRLVLSVDRNGKVFIWPIRLPNDDGYLDSYNESALTAAEQAKDKWVRVQANRAQKVYDTRVAISPGSEPVWPDENFEDLVAKAFGGRVIRSLDHPLVKRLKGEV